MNPSFNPLTLSSVNLDDGSVNELPPYPGVNGRGPVALTFLEDDRKVAACGTWSKSQVSTCYMLNPEPTPAWQQMSSSHVSQHCPFPYGTRSHYIDPIGWLVFGDGSTCSRDEDEGLSSEILALGNADWMETPIASPHTSGYPYNTCSVQLNSTHVFVSGGYFNDEHELSSAFILDTTNYMWTPAEPLITARDGHGCVLTASGEVLIAGGVGALGSPGMSSVHIYNPTTDTWREEGDLPDKMTAYFNPVMFLWRGKPILLESGSQNIWQMEEDDGFGGWQKLSAVLGSEFFGSDDIAILVPSAEIFGPQKNWQ